MTARNFFERGVVMLRSFTSLEMKGKPFERETNYIHSRGEQFSHENLPAYYIRCPRSVPPVGWEA
jgi:hypothetical protein